MFLCNDLSYQGGKGSSDSEEGLLAGFQIVVKDNINVKGFKTSAGTKALKEYRPSQDAPVIQTLKDAGAVVIGTFNRNIFNYSLKKIISLKTSILQITVLLYYLRL